MKASAAIYFIDVMITILWLQSNLSVLLIHNID